MKTSLSWLAIPLLMALTALGWWTFSDRRLPTVPRDEMFGEGGAQASKRPAMPQIDTPIVSTDVRPIRTFPSIVSGEGMGGPGPDLGGARPISTALKALMEQPEERVLEGTIRGPDRKGVVGAEIAVWSVIPNGDGSSIMSVQVASALSDSDGRFSIGGFVRLGERYLARVTHPDFAPLEVEGLDPMRRSSFRGTWVMDEGGRLEGTVVGAAKQAIAGAEASVFSLETSARHPDGVPEASVYSDSDGHFAFEHLGYGQKRILVSAPGYSTQEAMPVSLIPIAKEARPLQLRFSLQPGSTISGRVESSVSGLKLDGIRLRMRSLSVQRATFGPAASGSLGVTTTSAVDGAFSFNGVPDGSYIICAEDRDCLPINARAGADNLVLRVSEGGVIAGRVEAADTQGVITRFSIAAAPGTRTAGMSFLRVQRVENADGSFRITGLKPGPHMVMIQVSGCAPLSIGPFEVHPGKPLTGIVGRVKLGSVVEGRVVNEEGAPLAGASVSISEIIPAQASQQGAGLARRKLEVQRGQAVTFPDGSFVLPNVGPGKYFVGARSLEHLPLRSEVFEILEGQDTVLADLRLRSAASVYGQVVDATGRGDFQAIVFVASLDSGKSVNDPRTSEGGLHSASTDSEGRFFVEGLAPGRYRLWVSKARGSASPSIRPAAEEGTVVALQAGRPERVILRSQ